MGKEVQKRLEWVQLFQQLKNYTLVYLKCGILWPTLRKWVDRYHVQGMEGLSGKSRRPLTSPATRIIGRGLFYLGALPANPRDFTHSRQDDLY
jgi:hypothetical protein